MPTLIKLTVVLVLATTNLFYHSTALADVVVGDSSSLVSALAQSQAGDRIVLLAGTYDLDEGLYIRDGVTIAGEGVMQFDESGLPSGIADSGRTVLRSTPSLTGDLVTLGNGTELQGLVLDDIVGRAGNVVAVSSRRSTDFVDARISRCEINNPNPARASRSGPIGRGVLLVTRNPNLDSAPPSTCRLGSFFEHARLCGPFSQWWKLGDGDKFRVT